MGVDLFGLPSFLHLKMGTPQRRMAFVGRGEAKTQAVFSVCGKCSGVSCASTKGPASGRSGHFAPQNDIAASGDPFADNSEAVAEAADFADASEAEAAEAADFADTDVTDADFAE